MASRKIEHLHPTLQPIAREFIRRCQERGLSTFIVCTYRSNAEQDELYAQGRTISGTVVTNAKAGQSAHNKTLPDGTPASMAFDIGVLYNGKYDVRGVSPEWNESGLVGMELGLEWYGAPGAKFKEKPHFQLKQA